MATRNTPFTNSTTQKHRTGHAGENTIDLKPAFESTERIRDASSGSPGASYVISYVSCGNLMNWTMSKTVGTEKKDRRTRSSRKAAQASTEADERSMKEKISTRPHCCTEQTSFETISIVLPLPSQCADAITIAVGLSMVG